MSGTAHFPATDWRFNEFPNPAAHALYVTCVELMALPVAPDAVANFLLDVVAKGYCLLFSFFIFKIGMVGFTMILKHILNCYVILLFILS